MKCLTVILLFVLCSAVPAAEQAGNVTVKSFPVAHTKIKFPRITQYSDQRILKKVNSMIDDTTATFTCDGGQGSFDVDSNATYTEKDILSIYASSSYYCGGAYPTNDSNSSMTFDLKTGDLVTFTDLFADYERDQEQILRVIFGPKIQASEKATEKGSAADNEEGSCEDDPEIYSLDHFKDSSFNFNFASDGLHVQPDWPHVIEACSEIAVVPFSSLKDYAAPKGILARVLQ